MKTAELAGLAEPAELGRPAGESAADASADGSKSARRRVSKLAGGAPAPTYEGDFVLEEHLLLQCGRTLVRPTLHYAVYGRLSEARDNAVLACHALSGSALVGSWWPELFAGGGASRTAGPSTPLRSAQDDGIGGGAGEKQILRYAQDDKHSDDDKRGEDGKRSDDGKHGELDDEPGDVGIVDLQRDCVICVNLLGSCYGSTGPGAVNPETGEVYGPEFPLISISDNVRAQARLMDSLGIPRWKLAIGGSIGGMQALDWAILYPERVQRAVVIGVAPLGAMGLALNHLQRQAIQSDADWLGGRYLPQKQPRRGLALAREIAMLSYKSPALFAERFGRNPNRNGEDPWGLDDHGGGLIGGRFDVGGFLDYQGQRFVERFDANAYLAILRTMETWDPAREFRSVQEAFARIEADVTFLGISSDWLFPPEDVKRLAEEVRAAVRDGGERIRYREMVTDHGHDAFLAEQVELVRLVGAEK